MVLLLRLILNNTGETYCDCDSFSTVTLRKVARSDRHPLLGWVIGAARRSSAARRERSQLGYRLRQVLRTRQRQPIKNPPIGGLGVIQLSRVVINVDQKCPNTY